MKHTQVICLATLLLATATTSNAQWSGTNPVTTTSKVGIGTTTPIAKLEIKNTVVNDPCLRIVRAIPISSLSTNTVEIIDGDPSTSPPTTPRKLFWIDNAASVGIGSLATGGASRMVVADNNGLLSTQAIAGADNLGNHIATQNLAMNSWGLSNCGTILLGSSSATMATISSVSLADLTIRSGNTGLGVFASSGYKLDVNGNVRCVTLFQTSDKRFKKEINPLRNQTDRLYKINAYSYKFDGENKEYALDNRQHFGFMAQEVEQEFPDLVAKDDNGYYAVNYTEFIPLLLNALKEQKAHAASLEDKVATLEARLNALSATPKASYGDLPAAFQGSVLNQNTPNPFNKETTIRFNIAGRFSNAFIGVYDLNGKQIKRITIKESDSAIVIPAHLLSAGTYVYSLVVEGNLIDSKKMVVID